MKNLDTLVREEEARTRAAFVASALNAILDSVDMRSKCGLWIDTPQGKGKVPVAEIEARENELLARLCSVTGFKA